MDDLALSLELVKRYHSLHNAIGWCLNDLEDIEVLLEDEGYSVDDQRREVRKIRDGLYDALFALDEKIQ